MPRGSGPGPAIALLALLSRVAGPSPCPPAVLGLSPLPHAFAARDGRQCQLDDGWVVAATAASLRQPAEMLAAEIRARTGVSVKVVTADPGSKAIALRLPHPAPSLGGPQAFGAMDEGYHLDIDTAAVTVTAKTVRGVYYATRTFLQLLSKTAQAPACVIDDKPDLPVRGFYLDSKPSNALNQTFFAELAAMMGGLKMNSLILHNSAFLELSGASGALIKPNTLARLKNISTTLANHGIDMIAEVGPYYSFGSFEGLWVRDEPFRFDSSGRAQPKNPALDADAIGPRNPSFASDPDGHVDGWDFRGSGELPSPCRVDESTRTPSGGRTVRCDVTVDPKGAHAGGMYSAPFPIDAQAFYFVQASVKVNGTGRAPALVMGGVNESSANFGKTLANTNGEWITADGTFASPLDSACTHDCYATIFSRFVGSGTATWWIGDIKLLRLNGALLNVIRTNATDVNVTSARSGKQYTLGRDFELRDPATPPQHYDPPFLQMYNAGNESLSVHRLPSGSISPQEEVLISYDFGTNIIGEAKPNDPVAMAEPQHFEEAQAAIDAIMRAFPAPAVFFFETDEVRGINRDSRSARLGLSNADLLARDMNTLAGFVRANNPNVMPLFWGDMIHPLHNGATLGYQRVCAGKRRCRLACSSQTGTTATAVLISTCWSIRHFSFTTYFHLRHRRCITLHNTLLSKERRQRASALYLGGARFIETAPSLARSMSSASSMPRSPRPSFFSWEGPQPPRYGGGPTEQGTTPSAARKRV